jgi:hypothetical protein
VAFLGHVINQHGISVDPKNVAIVVNWQRPATVTEIHSFLVLLAIIGVLCRISRALQSH